MTNSRIAYQTVANPHNQWCQLCDGLNSVFHSDSFEEFFELTPDAAFLGVTVVLCGLLAWTIILLVRDPYIFAKGGGLVLHHRIIDHSDNRIVLTGIKSRPLKLLIDKRRVAFVCQ